MANTDSFVAFVCERLSSYGSVQYKKMFGDGVVYVNGHPIASVCDNTLYVKMRPEIGALMDGADTAPPYPGARPCYILNPEDEKRLSQLVPLLLSLPLPPSRRRGRR